MPAATEWSKDILQSVRGGLVSIARRIARPKKACSAVSAQSHSNDADPFAPLFDVLESFNADLHGFKAEQMRCCQSRLIHLEDARSTDPAQPHRPLRDPMGPVFDALEWFNSELAGVAARLAQHEGAAPHERSGTRLLVVCPRTCPAAECAGSRRAGRAVPDA